MDRDRRELVRRLFVKMTARLEDAAEIAAAGQSARASVRQYRAHARELVRIADNLGRMARATEALVQEPGKTSKNVR